ncbi:glyoxalase/bleomycin resistance protein/dioxygenase [Candidatus Moduliflexus flocculans]|uniref:Glyoxalase/bleomycin resistance protein/dioxygenase n=1 Tax=Candidatus Moduliflexus flocculans TaxID=1499966 RepID=A0A0S6W3S5_9BACT|nr:glyoxalase/bleomycin resistance protein/dioxygenase [Candidatus Moduliflexus flocculans]
MTPLFQKIDCVQFYVPDLEAGLTFYRDALGHELIWRTENAVGLRLPESDAEIVLQTQRPQPEIDLKVPSADAAAQQIAANGGNVLVPPFEIQIGRAAVVEDPWGNQFVVLDTTKGLLLTDDTGRILGNKSDTNEPPA